MADDSKAPYGDVTYADPGYQSDNQKRYPIDTEAHVRAAWSYINMPKNSGAYTAEQLSSIKGRIRSAAKKFGIEISDDSEDKASERAAPVEERAAKLDNVDFGQRILTLLAVPYEVPTPVEYRGEIWQEVFSRSAFEGFQPGARPVPVAAVLNAPSYDHNGGHLVGKVAKVYPERTDGLVVDVRISNTVAGDDTLQLAKDDALSPSVGFACAGRNQHLDKRSMVRRIHRAKLDHLSMVPVPAYHEARVLAMRDQSPTVLARDLPPLTTPAIDEYLADPLFQWADERLGRD